MYLHRYTAKAGGLWTNAAFVANVSQGHMHVCLGSPATQPFVRLQLGGAA